MFPRSTAGVRVGKRIDLGDLRRLDKLADRSALRHYAAELRVSNRRGLKPFVTVSHFSLPTWIHDPIAVRDALAGRGPDAALPRIARGGWLNRSTVREFRKYAAYLAWKFGPRVTYWTPTNEPMVVAANGYVNVPGAFAGYFPPGAFSFSGAIRVVTNLVRANAAAYDAIHAFDRRARVGPVHNMIAFTPADPASARDRAGAAPRRLPVQPALPERRGEGPRGPGRGRPGHSRRAPSRARGQGRLHRAELLLPQPRDRPRRLDQRPHQAARLPAAELVCDAADPDRCRPAPPPAPTSAGRSTPRASGARSRRPAATACRCT